MLTPSESTRPDKLVEYTNERIGVELQQFTVASIQLTGNVSSILSTAAYIVAFGCESYNSTGITSVDVECASGILKSLPASESRQWSDRAQEARRRRRVPVDGWPTYLSSFREVYGVIVYPQLLESPGTPVKAPGTIDRTFYELVFSIPGAFEDIADSSFDEIYKDLSGDLQDLLFASEEGEANFEEDTFYYVTRGAGRYTPKLLPRPLPVTPSPLIHNLSLIHGSRTRSLSQSSRIEDLGDEDPLPNTAPLTSRFRVRPIVPERRIFTSDLRVEFNDDRAAWDRWEADRRAHKRYLIAYLEERNANISEYDRHFQYHYRHPYDEDEDLSTPPSDNQESRRASPAPNMANNNDMKNMYFGFLRDLKYDGRTPIKDFLTDFGNIKNEIATLDPNFPGPMWLTLLRASLKDAESPPKKESTAALIPVLLVEKLKAKFNIDEDKTEADVVAELRRLHPDLSKITVKEFSDQFNEVIGDKDIAGYVLSEIFVAKMTPAILSEFKHERNWRKRRLTMSSNSLSTLMNLFDILIPCSQREAEKIAKLERENAEMKRINDVYVKAQKNHIASQTPRADTSNEGIVCWNCWSGPHTTKQCRNPTLSWDEREALRIQKAVKAPQIYQEARERASRKNVNVTSILTRNESTSSVDALPESVLEFGGFGDFECGGTKVDRSGKYEVGAGRRRVRKDTVYPTPDERNPDAEEWDVGVWVETVKLFGDPEENRLENEIEGYTEWIEMSMRGLHRVTIALSLPLLKIRNMRTRGKVVILLVSDVLRIVMELQEPSVLEHSLKKSSSNASKKCRSMSSRSSCRKPEMHLFSRFKIPAYLGNLLMQDIIADIGSEINIVDEQTLWRSVVPPSR
ncbi:hypothetical protein BDD12DRAFT_872115 [Trichophaea hybrida]|nr:hypothetical protein BDD12DRAFT_872115 [Trichophaea hybrida]